MSAMGRKQTLACYGSARVRSVGENVGMGTLHSKKTKRLQFSMTHYYADSRSANSALRRAADVQIAPKRAQAREFRTEPLRHFGPRVNL